jgi:septum site-determining protein MinD
MGKTIGILSLKGGVGKTSTVVSLGSALASLGRKVLLIDGNLSAPNLGIHLNIINPETTIHHVLDGLASARDSVMNLEDLDFDILPASIFYRGDVNPLKLRDKIKGLKQTYDIVLIDSSPAMNDETLAVMLASDELFVVTTPDYPTLSMTLKSVKDARSRGIRIDGLILNKVYNKSFELSLDEIEDTAEIPVLAVIPQDVNVVKSVSRFTPSYIMNPNSPGSREYRKLANVVVGEKQGFETNGLRRFMKITPKRQDINRELFYKRIFE